MNSPTTGLRKAFYRLAKSDTPIKRRNARKDFAAEIRAIEKKCDSLFPPMRSDGSLIVRRKSPSIRCPMCVVPIPTGALAQHCNSHHHAIVWVATNKTSKRVLFQCGCGSRLYSQTGITHHLSALHRNGKLADHFAMISLQSAAKGGA